MILFTNKCRQLNSNRYVLHHEDVNFIAHADHHHQVDEGETNQQKASNRFRHIEHRPGNVTAAALPPSHVVEYREKPQVAAWRPYQHRLLETKRKIRIRRGRTEFGVLKIDSRNNI